MYSTVRYDTRGGRSRRRVASRRVGKWLLLCCSCGRAEQSRAEALKRLGAICVSRPRARRACQPPLDNYGAACEASYFWWRAFHFWRAFRRSVCVIAAGPSTSHPIASHRIHEFSNVCSRMHIESHTDRHLRSHAAVVTRFRFPLPPPLLSAPLRSHSGCCCSAAPLRDSPSVSACAAIPVLYVGAVLTAGRDGISPFPLPSHPPHRSLHSAAARPLPIPSHPVPSPPDSTRLDCTRRARIPQAFCTRSQLVTELCCCCCCCGSASLIQLSRQVNTTLGLTKHTKYD